MRTRPIVAAALLFTACSSSSTPASTTTDATSDVAIDAAVEVALEAAPPTDASCTLVSAYSSSNKPCNDCAQTRCCAEVNGCLAVASCNDDYVNCTLGCALFDTDAGDAGVADCLAKCGVDYPKGKTEYDTAIGCVDLKCKTECG